MPVSYLWLVELILVFEIAVVISGLLSGHCIHTVYFQFIDGLTFCNEFFILGFGFELVGDALEGE